MLAEFERDLSRERTQAGLAAAAVAAQQRRELGMRHVHQLVHAEFRQEDRTGGTGQLAERLDPRTIAGFEEGKLAKAGLSGGELAEKLGAIAGGSAQGLLVGGAR